MADFFLAPPMFFRGGPRLDRPGFGTEVSVRVASLCIFLLSFTSCMSFGLAVRPEPLRTRYISAYSGQRIPGQSGIPTRIPQKIDYTMLACFFLPYFPTAIPSTARSRLLALDYPYPTWPR